MKFLVDAQLPKQLRRQLQVAGHDAVHTLDLPQGNRTPDALINQLSVSQKRIVVTKHADFVDSLIVQGVPFKSLLISTGNIKNSELDRLFFGNLEAMIEGFASYDFIEIDREALRFHF